MVSVSEADSIILSNLFQGGTEEVDLKNAMGRVLATPVVADRDFPPFDRVAMDGIAISFDSWWNDRKELEIESTALAGQPQATLTNTSRCIEVMTGAPLPVNTDTVIRYEDLDVNKGVAKITAEEIERLQNIHPQGQDAKAGQILVDEGFTISAAEVALMASVGLSRVNVRKHPIVAIVSTGDELVNIEDQPLPHQIRRSNSFAIAAELGKLKCTSDLIHIRDDESEMLDILGKALKKNDVLILSGGVSKGKFDFVPKTLEALGIKKQFHRVSQKPGKPFWFGTGSGKIVFALPGNPVSTFMCFHRYIKPWLIKSLGGNYSNEFAVLKEDFTFKSDLTYFLQVKIHNEGGKLIATPLAGGGSGDFANLKEVDGFLELPNEQSAFESGHAFPLYRFR